MSRETDFGVVLEDDEVRVPAPGPVDRFFRHGWHSFSPCRWVPVDQPVQVVVSEALRIGGDDPVRGESPRHGGSGLGAVELGGTGEVLLVGGLCLGARVEWSGDALEATCAEPPGRWYVGRGPEAQVFAEYAGLLGERFGARRGPAPRTWMSWYSFYEAIDEQRLAGVLDDLDGLGFQCVVVDDGWERAVGDWHAGLGFPSGMERLAARIRDAGYAPGLWIAPFLAPRDGVVWREHPEWLVRDRAGSPVRAGVNWGADYFGLDLTHPDALEHVLETVRRAVAWGFRTLKLDFLFAGAVPGPRVGGGGREHAYRHGVEAIRDAVGDEVRLLACGAPIIPSLGVFDAIRIGPDVAPWWENGLARHLHVDSEPATRGAIATAVHRLWLAPVIGCDPDVVYVRDRQQMLSRAQQALLRDLARVCDCRATSDPPAWLDPDELELLREFLREHPTLRRHGRYTFSVDGRMVDFSSAVH